MAQYVFTMNRVGKIVPPKRQILKDISLSFFPGAKIGLLGLNGSGKSTLIRIMAGVDKEIEGEATPMPNLNIGYLPQEPQLDPNKTVREAVEEGLGDVFNAYTLLGGAATAGLFLFHGAVFVALKTGGAVRNDALRFAKRLSLPVLAVVTSFGLCTQLVHGHSWTWIVFVAVVLALLCAISAIRYIVDSNLGVVAPAMMDDLHLDLQQIGHLQSAFLLGYAVCQFPAGILADRLGPDRPLYVHV